jgi:hypothetical protein
MSAPSPKFALEQAGEQEMSTRALIKILKTPRVSTPEPVEQWTGWRSDSDVLDVLDWAKKFRTIWQAIMQTEVKDPGDLVAWVGAMRIQVQALDEVLAEVEDKFDER